VSQAPKGRPFRKDDPFTAPAPSRFTAKRSTIEIAGLLFHSDKCWLRWRDGGAPGLT
jgi:hypothetical protein